MPPRRKATKGVKRTQENKEDEKEIQREEKKEDEEVERQIGAIRGIRDVEIEHTLTALSLLCSYFDEEQLQTPVLDFFKENLPDLSIATNQSGEIELKWNDSDGVVDVNDSILKRLSMGFPDLYNSSRPSLGGYHNAGASLFGTTDNANYENLVNGQRLSFGMTPKTRRQPKPGEIMLSVHGSPLGVYKEDDNMGAINEENS